MFESHVVAPRRSRLVEGNRLFPEDDEVVVDIAVNGVCASELQRWRGVTGHFPLRLGHEAAGFVSAVGRGVVGFVPGDRVTGLLERSFAEQVVTTPDHLVLVPDAVPIGSALGEPLGCVVHGVGRLGIEPHHRVAVVGLGFMGLLAVQVARAAGAGSVVAIGDQAMTRSLALELGADKAIGTAEVPASWKIGEPTSDWSAKGFDVVIEAAGSQARLDLATDLVAVHGVLGVLGYHDDGVRQVDVGLWNWKAVDVINAHVRRLGDLVAGVRSALDLVVAGQLSVERLVTHRFPLEAIDDAFAMLHDKPSGFVKAVVDVQ